MGYFDGTQYVTGGQTADDGRAGTRAGAHAREPEPIKRPGLREAAKALVPAGGDREPRPSEFDAGRSKTERRDLTQATQFVASMDGDHAGQYHDWLAAEQGRLDEEVGPAEDAREEHEERIALTLDLAERTEQMAAEMVDDQRDFFAWAIEQFGGAEAYDRWLSKLGDQDDQRDALTELAEEYLTEAQTDQAFSDWVADVLGEEGLRQLAELSDEDRTAALGELADAYAEQAGLDDDEAEDCS